MAEYIERKAVLDYIDHMPSELTSDGRRMIRRIRLTEYISDSIPAADVAPVRHGKWENNHCSVCGMMPMGEEIWDACDFCPPRFEFFMNYCPNCGARMDGGQGNG